MAAADKLTKLTRRHPQHVTAGEPKAMAQLKLKIMCLCVMKNKTKKDTKEHRNQQRSDKTHFNKQACAALLSDVLALF